jgi:hypothetical protein
VKNYHVTTPTRPQKKIAANISLFVNFGLGIKLKALNCCALHIWPQQIDGSAVLLVHVRLIVVRTTKLALSPSPAENVLAARMGA